MYPVWDIKIGLHDVLILFLQHPCTTQLSSKEKFRWLSFSLNFFFVGKVVKKICIRCDLLCASMVSSFVPTVYKCGRFLKKRSDFLLLYQKNATSLHYYYIQMCKESFGAGNHSSSNMQRYIFRTQSCIQYTRCIDVKICDGKKSVETTLKISKYQRILVKISH